MIINEEIELKFKAGGSTTFQRPFFSQDGRFLYVASQKRIVCYNTRTAKPVLECKCFFTIVGFGCLKIDNYECIFACMNTGKLIIWKPELGVKRKEMKLVKKACFFKVLPKMAGETSPMGLLGWMINAQTQTKIGLVNLDTGELDEHGIVMNEDYFCADVDVNGTYIAIVTRNNLLFKRRKMKETHIHSIHAEDFTCVACHPEEEIVLTGDSLGRILMWSNLTKKKISPAVYHWHSVPVHTLAFSASGTYFYSGGSERVLVKWQMNNEHQKTFLPRLPESIQHIVVAENNSFIAVAMEDSRIQILNPQFTCISTIQQLTQGNDKSAGIIYNPRSKSLVLNGTEGHLQFFSQKDMRILLDLDVAGQNIVTGETIIVSTLVTNVCIDKTGLWMATVEYSNDQSFPESRLKFWFFDEVNQSFTLNTCVDYPHNEKINDVAFQPSHNEHDLFCATVSNDKNFILWRVVTNDESKTCFWTRFDARRYRDLTPNTLSFSSDGSLLAIAFGSIATVWIPQSCELKCSLKHSIQNDDLIHLSFGVSTQCHLLMTATNKHISVWNLLTLSMIWTVPADINLVISDTFTSFKAAFTTDKKVFIFEPNSPNPIYCKEFKNMEYITAATFVPTLINNDKNLQWVQRTTISILNSNDEIYSLEAAGEKADVCIYGEDTGETYFGETLPSMKSGLIPQYKKTHVYNKATSADVLKELLDTPAHTMAPLHLTCEALLSSMLLENQKDESKHILKEQPVLQTKEVKKNHTLSDDENLSLLKDKMESNDFFRSLLQI